MTLHQAATSYPTAYKAGLRAAQRHYADVDSGHKPEHPLPVPPRSCGEGTAERYAWHWGWYAGVPD